MIWKVCLHWQDLSCGKSFYRPLQLLWMDLHPEPWYHIYFPEAAKELLDVDLDRSSSACFGGVQDWTLKCLAPDTWVHANTISINSYASKTLTYEYCDYELHTRFQLHANVLKFGLQLKTKKTQLTNMWRRFLCWPLLFSPWDSSKMVFSLCFITRRADTL